MFVYSPKVEGIHLRGGMVARGGLRWSDRPEDFRTEILGLMKAQLVKNFCDCTCWFKRWIRSEASTRTRVAEKHLLMKELNVTKLS